MECSKAVEWIKKYEPQVNSLRDADEEMLDKYVLPEDKLIDKRSRFIVKEIQRLQQGCDDLRKNDLISFGQKMFATHEGLSKDYGVSCKELDLLISHVKKDTDVIGARMMGGGFGGCTINLVKEEAIERLIAEIKPAYEAAANLPLTYYIASIENGTEIIQ
jgi:galactokinase